MPLPTTGNGLNGHLQKTLTVSPTTGEIVKPRSLLDTEGLRLWIRDHADPSQKKLQCVTFTLQHYDVTGWYCITAGHVPKELKGEDRERQIRNIVFEFEQASRVQADTNPRQAQHFRVGGHLTDKREDRADIQFSFLVKSEDAHAYGYAENPTEALDVGSIITGQQRLTEAQGRQSMSAVQQVLDRMLDDNRDLRKSFKELTDANIAMFKEMQTALDKKSERELREYKEKRSIDLENQILSGLVQYGFPLGATVLQKFTGINPLQMPASPAATGTQIGPAQAAVQLTDGPVSAFLKTLAPGQMVELLDVLNANQKTALVAATMGQSADVLSMLKTLNPTQFIRVLDIMTEEQRGQFMMLANQLLKEMSEADREEVFRLMQESKASRERESAG